MVRVVLVPVPAVPGDRTAQPWRRLAGAFRRRGGIAANVTKLSQMPLLRHNVT
jgi:hypothetical protein